ncbi:MAG: PrgI family protein [Lachnospiraceae bacterium]|nr:PrgI family protein [Lachnospiraceae bacterium]
MAYVTIPKDLTKVKNKVAFNLTLRQIVCIVVGAALGIPFYFLTRNYIGTSGAATGMVLLMLPEFLFAMYEKDGMHLEQILQNIVRVRFQKPAVRRYETENLYEAAVVEPVIETSSEKKKRRFWKKKKNPEEKPSGKKKQKNNSAKKSSRGKTKNGSDKKKGKGAAIKPGSAPNSSGSGINGKKPTKNGGSKEDKAARKKRMTVQDTIAYKEMGRDGICRVAERTYSKTIRFYDINYQLAQNEDKNAIFENWCDFLNYFDSTIRFQLSFINHKSNMREYENVIRIEPQDDAYDDVRMEYAQMLQNQLAKGKNGLLKSKYITFSIEAESLQKARPKLERIEADILNNFKVLGVIAYPLNGVERLQILFETFNPESMVPFTFTYDQILKTGMGTKDFIAPTSFLFKSGREFMMGDTYGAASYLQILAPELTNKMLAEFLDIDKNLIVNLHIQSLDQMKAIKLVKSKVTDINRMKIEEQKKAVRSGYDMDIIPSDLSTYGSEAKKLLDDLQSRNERMFLVTVTFLNTGKTKQELDDAVFQVAGIAQKYNCALRRLDYMQEEGLMSSLPLGINHIPIRRALTTTSTAIFVPFTTQELFMPGESLYYGLNALSNNMIMVDRKKLKNPNGLILGTPGSGKSFAAKREITNAFFVTQDDIIIGDPEGEYYPLVHELGGQVIHISATSRDYINPMDINMNYSDDDNPLGVKSDFILSLCELIMGSRNGIEAEEKSVIDRCLPLVYQKYFENPVPENMPVLGDLYDCLRKQKESQAQRIATALEIYVNGSLKVFNHQTNVELDNRIVCYDIKELGKQLKKLGMLIIQDQVWNRVTVNRSEHKSTRYYIDEFHLLLKEEQTAAYSVEIWKRFRKWGGIPTGITQNIKDLLASREIENILENSDFILMLNQAAGDRQILAKQLNISPYQLSYVTNSGAGEGLLFYGNTIIPFKDHFDKSLKLYSIMSTRPEDVAARQEQEA